MNTTPKSDGSFEGKREHAAELFSNCRNGKFNSANSSEWARSLEGFNQGAHWARAETIAEVLGIMRDAKSVEFRYLFEWAIWLESKLSEQTVVMKDPMYRIPDDEL